MKSFIVFILLLLVVPVGCSQEILYSRVYDSTRVGTPRIFISEYRSPSIASVFSYKCEGKKTNCEPDTIRVSFIRTLRVSGWDRDSHIVFFVDGKRVPVIGEPVWAALDGGEEILTTTIPISDFQAMTNAKTLEVGIDVQEMKYQPLGIATMKRLTAYMAADYMEK